MIIVKQIGHRRVDEGNDLKFTHLSLFREATMSYKLKDNSSGAESDSKLQQWVGK